MSAASRESVGETPGGADLIASTLRKGLRRQADPPADAQTDAPTDGPADAPAPADAGGITDPSVDPRVDAPARVGVEAPADAAHTVADGQTEVPEGHEAAEGVSGPQKPSQGPRRMLEVKARAYRGGWDKLRPRAVALADAVRDVLAVGGTPAEIRGLLAEVGVSADAVPPEVKEALKRRPAGPQG